MPPETNVIGTSSPVREGMVPPWYHALAQTRLARERLRAMGWRLLGAKIGPKCLFGARVRLDYPWGVQVGFRGQVEADVWFKLVSPSAREFAPRRPAAEPDGANTVSRSRHPCSRCTRQNWQSPRGWAPRACVMTACSPNST